MIPQFQRLLLLCVLLFIAGIQAKCSNPSVRREWRTLSREERAAWVSGVKCLNNLPHDPALTPTVNRSLSVIPPVNTSSSFWSDIAYMHMDLNILIHVTGYFLPWHRAFLWGVENAMKTKCGFKGVQPYWDWTQDASDFYHATIFDNDTEIGFGGWGDPDDDYQITTGAFAEGFPMSYPVPHRIRRNFTLQPYLAINIAAAPVPDPAVYINTTIHRNNTDYMINSFAGDFTSFQAYFEGINGPHGAPHLMTGGDMSGFCPGNAPSCVFGPKWSVNDPLFFMHHAMVDKVWYDWQNRHPMNQYAYHGGSVSSFGNVTLLTEYPNGAPPFLNFSSKIPNDGLLWDSDWNIWDMMDTTHEKLCYIYE